MFDHNVRCCDEGPQAVRIELNQVPRIDTIGIAGFPGAPRNTRWRNHYTGIAFVVQITLQQEADVGCLITQLQLASAKIRAEFPELTSQTLQGWSAVRFLHFPGVPIQRRPVLAHILDIDTYKNHNRIHRRLLF